jgi:hypothetical protein
LPVAASGTKYAFEKPWTSFDNPGLFNAHRRVTLSNETVAAFTRRQD